MLASQNFANGHNAPEPSKLAMQCIRTPSRNSFNCQKERASDWGSKGKAKESCAKSIKYINLPRNVHGKRIKKVCSQWGSQPANRADGCKVPGYLCSPYVTQSQSPAMGRNNLITHAPPLPHPRFCNLFLLGKL